MSHGNILSRTVPGKSIGRWDMDVKMSPSLRRGIVDNSIPSILMEPSYCSCCSRVKNNVVRPLLRYRLGLCRQRELTKGSNLRSSAANHTNIFPFDNLASDVFKYPAAFIRRTMVVSVLKIVLRLYFSLEATSLRALHSHHLKFNGALVLLVKSSLVIGYWRRNVCHKVVDFGSSCHVLVCISNSVEHGVNSKPQPAGKKEHKAYCYLW